VSYLLPKFDGFFSAFLATGLPAAFLIANAFVKCFVFKQTDFHFFGGDMVFCGRVLFTSTLLRELSLDHLPSGTIEVPVFSYRRRGGKPGRATAQSGATPGRILKFANMACCCFR
jgi:hypothetical protein